MDCGVGDVSLARVRRELRMAGNVTVKAAWLRPVAWTLGRSLLERSLSFSHLTSSLFSPYLEPDEI